MQDTVTIVALFGLFYLAGTLAELTARVLFGLGRVCYCKATGCRPLCLDDEVALAVARSYALKFTEAAGLPADRSEETRQKIAEGIHHVIVEYAYRCGRG
jgi:hypothetical protein